MCPRVADASDAGRLIEGTRPLGRPFLDRDATLGRIRHGERGRVQYSVDARARREYWMHASVTSLR